MAAINLTLMIKAEDSISQATFITRICDIGDHELKLSLTMYV